MTQFQRGANANESGDPLARKVCEIFHVFARANAFDNFWAAQFQPSPSPQMHAASSSVRRFIANWDTILETKNCPFSALDAHLWRNASSG